MSAFFVNEQKGKIEFFDKTYNYIQNIPIGKTFTHQDVLDHNKIGKIGDPSKVQLALDHLICQGQIEKIQHNKSDYVENHPPGHVYKKIIPTTKCIYYSITKNKTNENKKFHCRYPDNMFKIKSNEEYD